MKVVRIKVKTILLSVFLFFITIPYVFYIVGVIGFNDNPGVDKYDVSPYTVGVLKLYEKWPTIKFNKGKTLYMLAMSNYNYVKEKVVIYDNGIRANEYKTGNMEQVLIAKDYLKQGIELGEKDNYYVNNLNALINLEMTLGNTEQAFNLIENAKSSKEEVVYQMALLNEVAYYSKIGKYDKALAICKENGQYLPLLNNLEEVVYYLQGDFDRIKEEPTTIVYDDKYYKEHEEIIRKNILVGNANIMKDIDFIRKVEKYNSPQSLDTSKFGTVKGKVLCKGEPVPYIRVTLNMKNSYSTRVLSNENEMSIDNERSEFVAYTNENGEFIFNHALEGIEYEILTAIPSFLADETTRKEGVSNIKVNNGESLDVDIVLNDSIKNVEVTTDYKKDQLIIDFDKVDNANEYGVFIGIEGLGISLPKITNNNRIIIPLTKGSLQSFRILTGDVDDNGNFTVAPESYLGAIEENKCYIQVIAYDNDNKVISRSNGNIEVKLKKKGLNYGEKLINDKKIDEGYSWLYQKHLSNPTNIEYIYPLMRIAFERGDLALGDEFLNKIEEINKTGFDKAMRSYYVRG